MDDVNIKRRYFFIGPRPKELRTTLSLTPKAHAALSNISAKTGDTIPEVVCDALEAYLVHLAKKKFIDFPSEGNDN